MPREGARRTEAVIQRYAWHNKNVLPERSRM